MQGKRIVVGVCGGIAAFKAAALVSQLAQRGADVRVIMTRFGDTVCDAPYISNLVASSCST